MTEVEAAIYAAKVGAIFGISGAVLGAFLGIFGTYLVTIRLEDRRNKHLASIELRKAFMPVLNWLVFTDRSKLHDIHHRLTQEFIVHSIAVDNFLFYLKGKNRANFKKVWYKYYGNDEVDLDKFDIDERIKDDVKTMLLLGKYCHTDSVDKAIENIKAILVFTEPQNSNPCPFKKRK